MLAAEARVHTAGGASALEHIAREVEQVRVECMLFL